MYRSGYCVSSYRRRQLKPRNQRQKRYHSMGVNMHKKHNNKLKIRAIFNYASFYLPVESIFQYVKFFQQKKEQDPTVIRLKLKYCSVSLFYRHLSLLRLVIERLCWTKVMNIPKGWIDRRLCTLKKLFDVNVRSKEAFLSYADFIWQQGPQWKILTRNIFYTAYSTALYNLDLNLSPLLRRHLLWTLSHVDHINKI